MPKGGEPGGRVLLTLPNGATVAPASAQTASPPFFVGQRANSYSSLLRAEQLYKDHDHRIAVIVGSGPSLEGFDWSQLDRPWIYSIAINDKGFQFREHYTPSAWMFYDTGVLKRYATETIPDDMDIFTRESMTTHALKARAAQNMLADWSHRIRVFSPTKRWDLGSNALYMSRTTSAAATCLAVRMGFKKIILIGCDCYCFPDKYYDKRTDVMPRKLKGRAKTPLGADGRYAEDRHIMMMNDFTHVADTLKKAKWPGRVVQASILSPMSCFEKLSWGEAINQLRN